MSLMNYKGFGKETFVGFANYSRALKDVLFQDAFVNTLKMWGLNIVLQLLMSLGIISEQVNWLKGEAGTAQAVVGIVGAWMWFGNSFIMLMAGVQGINSSYFEAATIDGANRWQVFSKITMPLLRPIMLYVAVTSLIGGLQLFDIPYLLSGTTGEPGRALYTAVFYLYTTAFKNNQMGYAAALAFVLFLIIAVFCGIAFKLMNPKEDQ